MLVDQVVGILVRDRIAFVIFEVFTHSDQCVDLDDVGEFLRELEHGLHRLVAAAFGADVSARFVHAVEVDRRRHVGRSAHVLLVDAVHAFQGDDIFPDIQVGREVEHVVVLFGLVLNIVVRCGVGNAVENGVRTVRLPEREVGRVEERRAERTSGRVAAVAHVVAHHAVGVVVLVGVEGRREFQEGKQLHA